MQVCKTTLNISVFHTVCDINTSRVINVIISVYICIYTHTYTHTHNFYMYVFRMNACLFYRKTYTKKIQVLDIFVRMFILTRFTNKPKSKKNCLGFV